MSKSYVRLTMEDGTYKTVRSKKKITQKLVAQAVKIEFFTPIYVNATETFYRNEDGKSFRIERHPPLFY